MADPDKEGGGAISKFFFRPFGPQYGLKINEGPGPSPGPANVLCGEN